MPVRITKTKETKKNNMQLITKLHDEKQVETFRREFAKFHRRLKHQGLDISFENYLVTDSTSS